MGESGVNKEQLLLSLCQYLDDEGYGDVEAFFRENNIDISQVDSYIHDADDKGYSQHTIYIVKLDKPFYFIHEWYGGRWEPLGSAIYTAEPYQATKYDITSEDFTDKYYESKYDWEEDD